MGRARSVGIFGLALVTGGLVGGGLALALAPRAGRETRAQVRRAADEALYSAKRAGKNQVATTDSPEKVL